MCLKRLKNFMENIFGRMKRVKEPEKLEVKFDGPRPQARLRSATKNHNKKADKKARKTAYKSRRINRLRR